MDKNKKVINFYDTNIFLHNLKYIEENGFFMLSSVTLQELENIKTSGKKDEQVRYEARKASRFLLENEDNYEVVVAQKKHHDFLKELELDEDNDNLIMACAKLVDENIIFYSNDICCYNLGKNIFKLNVHKLDKNKLEKEYTGYIVKQLLDNELAKFYESGLNKNTYGLLTNQYLIIKDSNGEIVDSYKWNGEVLVPTEYKSMQSMTLGKLKAMDRFQMCALDSFQTNQITMIKGKAGSGKSYLSMGYLFHQLEKGKIDKIIIFTNPVATKDSAKLGYYPGSKDEKLIDSSVGNFLSSKLGDKCSVEMFLQKGKIVLLPMSDIRGYDTTGMKAGIYITEAQNMSIDLMKLAMQRIGEDSIAIIDGDYNTQVDSLSFSGANNGMKRLSEVFRGHSIYGEVELNTIYRSEIAKIAEEM